jgi:hypothetical protein
MVQISILTVDARTFLTGQYPKSDTRIAYREAIAHLTATRLIELEPDAGETIETLKLRIARAAKELDRQIGFGESRHGTLLIWLKTTKQGRTTRSTPSTRTGSGED